MRKILYFSLFLANLFLFACQPPLTFTEPQPKDVAALKSFPNRIQGQYLSARDSSLLKVTSGALIRTYDFDQKIHVSQVDSNHQIIGDTLFDLQTNKGQFIRFEADSIIVHINETDTVFCIDDKNILKKYKGYYFLNIYSPERNWEVKELELSHGKLVLSAINAKEDLTQLKAITETTEDTAITAFSPSRKQFREFVREDGFRDREEFVRIRR